MNKLNSSGRSRESEIAVIGMSGRFPGARDLKEFWRNLRDGVESVSFFADEELHASGVGPEILSRPNYVKAGAVIEDVELFDASFFGFSPREAEMMDPQQRLFLEEAWSALEDAGYDSEQHGGRIAVFAGISSDSYFLSNLYTNLDLLESAGLFQLMIGNENDHLSTRISYKLNLKGPSMTVQTACSTSLVAVHLACQSLLIGECDLALAGGVSVRVPQKTGYSYHADGINSPDGHCRAFDAMAQGTVGGNGLGLVVLKVLDDALADGDTVHAVIKGSSVNNDGALKAGYTAPSITGQFEVISEALAMAGLGPDTISYVEAHGTGTPIGDPIEIAALTRAYRSATRRKAFCAIGSVKTNIGHLGAAAGVAGLIKTVLAIENKEIPPSLHFERPNPEIDFANSPFFVNNRLSSWNGNGAPRRAAVSSFGLGGTNAHVVLEEAPATPPSSESRLWQLLLLSAKTESSLERATDRLVNYLGQNRDARLADVAYTLQVGRRPFSQRRMLVCRSADDAIASLDSRDPTRVITEVQRAEHRPVAFMFSGLGDHYVNMALGLYRTEAGFAEQIDLSTEILNRRFGIDLRGVLYPDRSLTSESGGGSSLRADHTANRIDFRKMLHRNDGHADEAAWKLNQTSLAQPAVFIIEYCLAKLLMTWGVTPAAMIGYSIGEYVAACLAGVFSLEDALYLVARRALLIEGLPQGAMLAAPLSEKELQSLLGDSLSVAAVNGSSLSVASGPKDAIEDLERKLADRGAIAMRLQASHAFHSKMMEPLFESFRDVVKSVELKPPQIPLISDVTGTWMTAEEATDPGYWARHLCEAVRFADGIGELLKEPHRLLLEIGPGQTLCSLAMQHPDHTADHVVLSCLRHSYDHQPDLAFLLNTVGKLWATGVEIDWSGFYAAERRHRIPLPTYPFDRRRYWIDRAPQNAKDRLRPSLGKKSDIADWFYVPIWKQSVRPDEQETIEAAARKSRWLLFTDGCGLGSQIGDRLEKEGCDVVRVTAGNQFLKFDDKSFEINPGKRDDYDELLSELRLANRMPEAIYHLWCVTSSDHTHAGVGPCTQCQDSGFYSLLFLAQSIGAFADPVELVVVSNNLHQVTGDELLHAEKATVLGPCKVIPREFPNIKCRSIDVVVSESDSKSLAWLAEGLVAELASGDSESVSIAAYRGTRRWVPSFEAVRLAKPTERKAGLRQEGVYLITGGLGGIGLALAKHLARAVRARIVLVGRSAFPPRHEWETWLETREPEDDVSHKIRQVQALEQLGAEVMVASADVADQGRMREVADAACERFGDINGVIHAAGIAGGGLMQLKTPEMAAAVLEAKVAGTLTLDAVLSGRKLDFIALCSSMGAVLGGLGEVDYCGANAFLDAFAHYNNSRQRTFTISINWDVWQQVGLAVNTPMPADLKKWREQIVSKGILPEEGADAFDRILGNKLSQVIVSTQDFHALIDQHNAFTASAAFEQLERAQSSRAIHQRPFLGSSYVAPANELERTICGIWQELLGIDQIGRHDNFFELGGHSLLGTLFISRLRDALQTELSLHSLFQSPTVAGLAARLLKNEVEHESDERLKDLLAELEELSDEETDRMLEGMMFNDKV